MSKSIDAYWDTYKSLYGFESVLKIYRARKILEVMNRYSPKTVLEIGCGYEPSFVDYPEFTQFVAVEPGENAFEHVSSISQSDNRVVALKGRFEEVYGTIPATTFDMVILPGVLHELENVQEVLETISKVSNSNTIFYVNVPNASSMHRLLGLEMGIINAPDQKTSRNVVLEQNKVYSSLTVLEELRAAWPHMTVLESGTFFLKPFTHEQMEAMASDGHLNKEIFEGLYKISHSFPDHGCELFVVGKIATGE